MVNPYDVIMLPWITEKAMEARTSGNRLEFIVRRSATKADICLLYTSPSPRDKRQSRMPSSA